MAVKGGFRSAPLTSHAILAKLYGFPVADGAAQRPDCSRTFDEAGCVVHANKILEIRDQQDARDRKAERDRLKLLERNT